MNGAPAAAPPAPRPALDPVTRARRHHRDYLILTAIVLGLSVILANDAANDVRLAGWKLPPMCPMKFVTGIDCPGCGLTRAFVAIGHGDLAESYHWHRVGLALYVVALYQLVYRPLMIWRGLERPGGAVARVHAWVGRALIAALVLNWLWNRFV